jgi:hypothetical protein
MPVMPSWKQRSSSKWMKPNYQANQSAVEP